MDSTEGQDDFRKLHRLLKLNHVGIVGDSFLERLEPHKKGYRIFAWNERSIALTIMLVVFLINHEFLLTVPLLHQALV